MTQPRLMPCQWTLPEEEEDELEEPTDEQEMADAVARSSCQMG
jgi:hypothetical protein